MNESMMEEATIKAGMNQKLDLMLYQIVLKNQKNDLMSFNRLIILSFISIIVFRFLDLIITYYR